MTACVSESHLTLSTDLVQRTCRHQGLVSAVWQNTYNNRLNFFCLLSILQSFFSGSVGLDVFFQRNYCSDSFFSRSTWRKSSLLSTLSFPFIVCGTIYFVGRSERKRNGRLLLVQPRCNIASHVALSWMLFSRCTYAYVDRARESALVLKEYKDRWGR